MKRKPPTGRDSHPKTREEILRILQAHKAELRERYGVRELGLFGSYVRGEQRRRSDVDILVEFDTVPGLLKFLELEEYLSRLLGLRVDLVRRASIRKELRERILSEVVMV
jgi:predicted nucleotidyltransferase